MDSEFTNTSGAARIIGVSPSRIVQLDDVLQPALLEGRYRIYKITALEALAASRDHTGRQAVPVAALAGNAMRLEPYKPDGVAVAVKRPAPSKPAPRRPPPMKMQRRAKRGAR